ncbi:MAG TPA: type II secretion system protein N [Sphingobium sp.]|nr:type II secretion system protein N [Sphingobium sp.]
MRRTGRAPAKASSDWGQWLEAFLLVLLLIQIARLLWTLVTPVGPLGEWRAREPVVIGSDARRALFAGFDPFFRTGAMSGEAVQQVTALPLKLYGISLNEASGRGSAIIADESDVQTSYAVGDEITPGVVLKAVAFDHVVIQRGGATETLFIDQSSGAVAEGAETPDGAAPALPAQPATGALEPSSLTNALGLAPRTENGKVTGIVASAQGNDAMFALAGFRPGDIVVQINGQPVTSAGDINMLRNAIRPGARLSLMVERGAATVPISLILPENK